MCRSKAEGGRRCTSTANRNARAALHQALAASRYNSDRVARIIDRFDETTADPHEADPVAWLFSTSFRGHPRQAAAMFAAGADPYFLSKEWTDFARFYRDQAREHDLAVRPVGLANGLWEGEDEPSVVLAVRGPAEDAVALASKIATRYNQDAVMVIHPEVIDDPHATVAGILRSVRPQGRSYFGDTHIG